MAQYLIFDVERETKGTIRFAERVPDDLDPVVGTLYVRKAALAAMGHDGESPLTVTIALDSVRA